MNHDQEASLAGHPEDHETLFGGGVVRVRNRNRKRVAKNGARLRKAVPCFR